MIAITENEIIQACRTLFGKKVDISRDFLYKYIQPSGVKSAYRKKAKENHPDLFASDPLPVQQKQTALFRDILQAYDVLNLFFEQREKNGWKPAAASPQARAEKREAPPPRASSPHQEEHRGDDIYYKGSVPQRTLQIGRYLYYRGKISFGALINALMWQRKQRPSIGEIAVQWGLLDAEAVTRIFNVCGGKPKLFGEKAVELGLLTIFQVNTILLYQRSQQLWLGHYFVRNNILTATELDRLVQELKEHNAGILAAAMERKNRQPVHA